MRITLLVLFFSPLLIFGQTEITGTVVYVSDGDTFHLIQDNGEKIKVRVADIDCPERTQDYGLEAKAFVIAEIKDRTVSIVIKDSDRYGRKIAFVKYDGKDLSEELLKNGFAWHYKKYSELEYLSTLEEDSRNKKKGLWADLTPMAPWDYRSQKRKSN